jgi:hypothetical protein
MVILACKKLNDSIKNKAATISVSGVSKTTLCAQPQRIFGSTVI